jgi:hypothetical protein
MNTLLTITFKPSETIWCYVLFAAFASVLIRTVLSFLTTNEGGLTDWFKRFVPEFLGCRDYWETFLLGWLEISIFPVFIAINKLEYIAGWFVLKTLPQWKCWTNERNIYNRFLIGNAIVLLISWWLALKFFV